MLHKFATFEIDEARRELRAGGRVLQVQPRVFDLLAYLARNRERVVSKDELLDALWAGVIVADGSLQRAVSLARTVLTEAGAQDPIRTFPRQGYRLVIGEPRTTSDPGAGVARAPRRRPLLDQIWELLNKSGRTRRDLDMADELCRMATQLEPGDADAWASSSQADSWYVYHNFDASPARREAARGKAARALQLAPRSFEARLAQACYLVRGGRYFRVSLGAEEAENILRGLLEEVADEPRALLALAILLRNTGEYEEALAMFGRLERQPGFATTALEEKGWLLAGFMGRYREGKEAADRAVALGPDWINLGLQIHLAQMWDGDLDLARAALRRLPASILLEDWGVYHACEVFRWRREPAEMLHALEAAPRDWLASNAFNGPLRFFTGIAHEMAGRAEAARVEWRAALALLEDQIEQQPHNPELHYRKGVILSRMARPDESRAALELYQAYGGGQSSYGREMPVSLFLGDLDSTVAELEHWIASGSAHLTAANLRLNPDFDPLRELPRFRKLVARLERSPAHTPTPRKQPGWR